jgi:hypothetical protein
MIWPNNVREDPKPLIETGLAEENMALRCLHITLRTRTKQMRYPLTALQQ